MKGVALDLTGQRFGRTTALERGPNKGKKTTWRCVCDCGDERTVTTDCLTRGGSLSCGCLHSERLTKRLTTHGKSRSSEYNSWQKMMERCTDPNCSQYKDYGGRGITVCERWRVPANFFEDMGDKPSPHHTLDRIENSGNYEPGNCRWATRKEQNNNTRRNRQVTVRGKRMTVTEAAERFGADIYDIRRRLLAGGTIEEALGFMSTPIPCQWTGDSFVPLPRFRAEADKRFVVGQNYILDEIEMRSAAAHRRFFACVNEAWSSLPETAHERFPNPDSLRKYALIRTGFYDSDSIVCSSAAEARRIATFVRPRDEFVVVTVDAATVTRYWAKTQNMRAMGKDQFNASADAVLNFLAEMLGTTTDELQKAQAA